MVDEKSLVRLDDSKLKEIGERIGVARRAASISAIDLAGYIGIGSNQLSRIENGKVPAKIEYLYLMPQILNVSVDEILYGDKSASAYKEITEILKGLDGKQLEVAKNVLKAVFG